MLLTGKTRGNPRSRTVLTGTDGTNKQDADNVVQCMLIKVRLWSPFSDTPLGLKISVTFILLCEGKFDLKANLIFTLYYENHQKFE